MESLLQGNDLPDVIPGLSFHTTEEAEKKLKDLERGFRAVRDNLLGLRIR